MGIHAPALIDHPLRESTSDASGKIVVPAGGQGDGDQDQPITPDGVVRHGMDSAGGGDRTPIQDRTQR